MTLILGMSKLEGIYLSADFRVTDPTSGDVIDDASVKLLDILFPPAGGTRGLLAYTGLAKLPDGTPMGTWLVETMRGESEIPDQAMAHLLARLNRDVAPRPDGLTVNVLLIEGEHGERRLFGEFTNRKVDARSGRVATLSAFEYLMTELHGPFAFANGSGATRVIADGHLARVHDQLTIRPRRAFDHMKLLASVNRRVAEKVKTVSPACHVAFVPAERPAPGASDDRFGPQSRSFTERGEAAPAVMPMLLFGIDTSIMVRRGQELFAALEAGGAPPPELDADTVNRSMRRRD